MADLDFERDVEVFDVDGPYQVTTWNFKVIMVDKSYEVEMKLYSEFYGQGHWEFAWNPQPDIDPGDLDSLEEFIAEVVMEIR